MKLKKILHGIQNQQISSFRPVSVFRSRESYDALPNKRRGLYWIWTDHWVKNLLELAPRENTKEVPISELVLRRNDLKNVCDISHLGFKIFYNGIGGYKKTPAAFGLRERINQELNCNDKRTGTLNLINRVSPNNSVDNWAVSFFDFDDENNREILGDLTDDPDLYLNHAKNIEIDWRIEFGTPILTRH